MKKLREVFEYGGVCKTGYFSVVFVQEAKYVERWPNTTSAWAGWSRFDIPVDRYGGVHSLLHCTSITLMSPTCHQASQQENTYRTKYQKADRASTLITLWFPSPGGKPMISPARPEDGDFIDKKNFCLRLPLGFIIQ
jgi:hypothetical protein